MKEPWHMLDAEKILPTKTDLEDGLKHYTMERDQLEADCEKLRKSGLFTSSISKAISERMSYLSGMVHIFEKQIEMGRHR